MKRIRKESAFATGGSVDLLRYLLRKEEEMPYKIVSRSARYLEYGSLTQDFTTGGVIYKVVKPTHPRGNCGPLAAFKTLQDVYRFKKQHGWDFNPVFKCKVKREKYHNDMFFLQYDKVVYYESVLPHGTILCSEITLTKSVNERKKIHG